MIKHKSVHTQRSMRSLHTSKGVCRACWQKLWMHLGRAGAASGVGLWVDPGNRDPLQMRAPLSLCTYMQVVYFYRCLPLCLPSRTITDFERQSL